MSKGKRLHIDLCCGLGGWQAPFREDPTWTSVGLDVRRDLDPDVVADVRELPLSACEPTLLTMSPPCTEFSYWDMPFSPDDFTPSLELIEACLDVVDDLDPRYWIMENVRGLHRWWQPADKVLDPWYFWGEFPPFDPQRVGKGIGDLNRLRHRYDPTSTKRPERRSLIPRHLSHALKRSVEVFGNV